jgi:hypothetical protein
VVVIGTVVVVAVHFHAIIAAEVIVKPVDRVYVSTSPTVVDIALFMHPNLDQTGEVPAVIYCCQEAPALDPQRHFVAACHHACVATASAAFQAVVLA